MLKTRVQGLLGGAFLVVSLGAQAAPIDAARAVASAVLAGYTKAGKSDTSTFSACPQYCDPAFAKIIDRVDKLGGDDGPGPFDADIFCGCQDYDH